MLWEVENKDAKEELYLYIRDLLFVSFFLYFSSGMSFSSDLIWPICVYGRILHNCYKKWWWNQKKSGSKNNPQVSPKKDLPI